MTSLEENKLDELLFKTSLSALCNQPDVSSENLDLTT